MTATLRVVAGGVSLPLGAILLLLPPFGAVWAGAFAGLVIAVGGLVLLRWDRLGLTGWLTALVAVVAGTVGTAAGLAVSASHMCCMFSYGEGRGWPYAWLSRGGVADTPGEAVRLAEAGGWGFSSPAHLLGNAVVWAYAGVVLLAVISVVRRSRRDRHAGRG